MRTANSYICDLAAYQPGLPIDQVARQYGHDPKDIIKLASNENPLGASPAAVRAVKHAVNNVYRYPEQFLLVQALARHCGVDQDMVVLGNGSNDILDLLARTYLSSGDSAILSQYAFAVYHMVTQATGAGSIIVPSISYEHDLVAMAQAVNTTTKIIWIANPNNPTGTFAPHAQIRQLLGIVPSDVIIVLDEAYGEYLDPEDRVDTTR